MRKLCFVLALLIFSGCAGTAPWPEGRKRPGTPMAQYNAAQKSFQDKLTKSVGLTLAELKSQWSQMRQGPTRNQSTIYTWVRTISVAPPPGAATELGLTSLGEAGEPSSLSLSCLAVFIVGQDGVVAEASSEGRCLDPKLMPDWRPRIEAAGDLPRST
jgi:hypothetical protein